jgi:hypothetical protein
MHGPSIVTSSMSVPTPRGPSRALWQYHSRSDLHSKVACWGAFFDLLSTSALLQKHASTGKVIFGVNFEMRDYAADRKKDLDLVIARPSGPPPSSGPTLEDLARRWGVVLTTAQSQQLSKLPVIRGGQVTGSGVLVALEAKAAMTAHGKAQPRLYDELNSSHACVHGASTQALAVGLVMVNASSTFVSPGLQQAGVAPVISTHPQPAAAAGIVAKVKQLPRRTNTQQPGFDGLGIIVVDAVNDGSPVTLVSAPPAPVPGEIYFYDDMVTRVANEYDTRFGSI